MFSPFGNDLWARKALRGASEPCNWMQRKRSESSVLPMGSVFHTGIACPYKSDLPDLRSFYTNPTTQSQRILRQQGTVDDIISEAYSSAMTGNASKQILGFRGRAGCSALRPHGAVLPCHPPQLGFRSRGVSGFPRLRGRGPRARSDIE